ncbi:MAG: aldo/keto reductase [Gammaproteobacteria bacterium SG8_47]|nr:MAG: aldo/keto reductase [Gammaproteobacteria bacterium SG8_47]
MHRRTFLKAVAAGVLGARTLAGTAGATEGLITRPVPRSGERLPAIGMGSWLTFDVGDDAASRTRRVEVLRAFFERGGAVIDSSPMYGSSEEVIGHCLAQLDYPRSLFSATKVWTWGGLLGRAQMDASRDLWGVPRFDLMQIHNLLDWDTHLETLRAWKAEGKIRYIGVTTSHGRRHEDLLEIMRHQDALDFVQFTYNLLDREAEQHLLPLAAERGLAVVINRPFRRGALFDHVAGKALPAWAGEFGCANWAQFFLKFIVSHPAVTCAIPATTQVAHMHENMGAAYGEVPDAKTRRRMVSFVAAL